MKVRKFYGPTSRAVLEQIRIELGADAMIVANHPTAQGVEISALPGGAVDALLDATTPSTRRSRVSDAASNAMVTAPPVLETQDVAPEPSARVDDASLGARVLNDLAAMRSLLETQVAQLTWSDSARRKPLRAQLTQELIASGYSPSLAREVTQRLPDDCTLPQTQQWVLGVIAGNLRCVDAADDIVARGGVYALVGPTGVGKTTTTAKLAARCAVRHGSASLALLTTDSYRIGAQDQLRIYAKILGVSVQTVNDASDLRQALDALADKHLVLIDTVGMSQRDTRMAEHAMVLAQPEVRRLLLLNATSQGETLDEVVAAYGAPNSVERGLDGCIITKQDESARPGQVLDVIIRHRLNVHYVSNGQRVPEDLQNANASYLAHRSIKRMPQTSPFRLHSDEVALVLAGAEAVHV